MVLPRKRVVGIIRYQKTAFARMWSGKTLGGLLQNDAHSAGSSVPPHVAHRSVAVNKLRSFHSWVKFLLRSKASSHVHLGKQVQDTGKRYTHVLRPESQGYARRANLKRSYICWRTSNWSNDYFLCLRGDGGRCAILNMYWV